MVQAISLREEVLDRTSGRDKRGARGFVDGLELRRLARSTRAFVPHTVGTTLDRHVGCVVGQIEKRPRRRDGEPAGGVEAEKVRLAFGYSD
jgi:hypothetical protein